MVLVNDTDFEIGVCDDNDKFRLIDEIIAASTEPPLEEIQELIAAAQRLWSVANRNSGQCAIIAQFLLSLYNSSFYKFKLSEFRILDNKLFEDCILAIKLDKMGKKGIHQWLGMTDDEFYQLAIKWNMTDKS